MFGAMESPGTVDVVVTKDSGSSLTEAKLTAARFSNIVNVDVNTTNGIVTLAGEVPNPQVKADAEREVRTVDGVRGINNNLQVKNPPSP